MLVIWGRLSSVNVQKVMFAVGTLGLPHERREAGGAFGVVGTPEYGALNPNRLVPCIEDDGFVLWESNAIVRYLAARHGSGTIWPVDPAERALADRWMDWQTTVLTPALGPAFWGLIRTPPENRDAAAIEASMVKTEAALALLDAHLAGREFLEHDRLTIADLAVGPPVHRWLHMPVARLSRPNVERWYATLAAMPAAAMAFPLPVT
ncbi:MAG: glutathione S-transferase family protein [Alsobacter sp.]